MIKNGWFFWLQWVGCTLLGFAVSLYWIEISEPAAVKGIAGFVGGLIIGTAQWLVLRQQCSASWGWILATTLTWTWIGSSQLSALGWVVPPERLLPLRIIDGVIHGAMVGALLGVAQWLVLRLQVGRASWWIWASMTSWAFGLALGWAIGTVLRSWMGVFLGEVVGLVSGWLIVGAVTGLFLLKLLRRTVRYSRRSRLEEAGARSQLPNG